MLVQSGCQAVAAASPATIWMPVQVCPVHSSCRVAPLARRQSEAQAIYVMCPVNLVLQNNRGAAGQEASNCPLHAVFPVLSSLLHLTSDCKLFIAGDCQCRHMTGLLKP